MKAVMVGAPGHVEWAEVDLPPVGPGEVLLRPLACGICATDVKAVRRGRQQGAAYALGHELVGRVAAAGEGARWQPGARVVAAPYVPCGACPSCLAGQPTLCERLFAHNLQPGALAEQVLVPRAIAERGLFDVPEALPSEVAALSEPVGCCLHGLEACDVGAGTSLLVVGDGPMGLLNAIVARALGASPIVVAGLTPARLQAAAAYADVIVNVTEEDLARRVRAITGGGGADVVLVAVSSAEAVASGLEALRRGGVLNAFAGVPEGTSLTLDLHQLHYSQIRLTGSFGLAPSHLTRALGLLARRQIDAASLITARFPFAETAAALDYAARQAGLKAVVVWE